MELIMNDIFRRRSVVKLPPRKNVEKHDQYGKEPQGLTRCPLCRNVHFKKKWLPSLRTAQKYERRKRLFIAGEELCPACHMVREHLFEGEIMVVQCPQHFREELLNLIRNYGARASSRDPQHRIIHIEHVPEGIRITTTENQLANRLSKKIRDVFNKVDVEMSYSREPYEVNRTRVTFEE